MRGHRRKMALRLTSGVYQRILPETLSLALACVIVVTPCITSATSNATSQDGRKLVAISDVKIRYSLEQPGGEGGGEAAEAGAKEGAGKGLFWCAHVTWTLQASEEGVDGVARKNEAPALASGESKLEKWRRRRMTQWRIAINGSTWGDDIQVVALEGAERSGESEGGGGQVQGRKAATLSLPLFGQHALKVITLRCDARHCHRSCCHVITLQWCRLTWTKPQD